MTSNMADENEHQMNGCDHDPKQPQVNDEDMESDSEEAISLEDLADECSEEYASLNCTLDQLDACLNKLEERNDTLFANLQELLQDTKQTREELHQERLELEQQRQQQQQQEPEEQPDSQGEGQQ